jgi:hypothetical protein
LKEKPSFLIVRKNGPALRFDFVNDAELTVSEWCLILDQAKLQLMGFKPNTSPANLKIPGMLTGDLTRQ